jgi:biopolymer transport protein ExbB
MNLFEFIKHNLSHVLPILLAGAFGFSIMIERAIALFWLYPIQNLDGFFAKISEHLRNGKAADAAALCDQYKDKPLAGVVKAVLERAHMPEDMIENGVEMALKVASQKVQKRTLYLGTIANIATLLGLFGTIAGLIASFEAVGHADPQQKSTLLSLGIATAMNATMMGLGVAIPCMVAFSFLMNKSSRLLGEIEHSAVRAIDTLKATYYSAAGK